MPTYGESAPTKTGYTFGGFYDGSGGTGTQYYKADLTSNRNWNKDKTSGTTLYAKWTAKNYNVTYSAGSKTFTSAPSATSIAYGSSGTLASGTITSTDGYVCTGWATTSGGAKAYELGGSYTMNTEGATLYAVWERANADLTLDLSKSTVTTASGKSASSFNIYWGPSYSSSLGGGTDSNWKKTFTLSPGTVTWAADYSAKMLLNDTDSTNNDGWATDIYVGAWGTTVNGSTVLMDGTNYNLTSSVTLYPTAYRIIDYELAFDTTKGYFDGVATANPATVTGVTISTNLAGKSGYSATTSSTTRQYLSAHYNYHYKTMINTVPAVTGAPDGYVFGGWYYYDPGTGTLYGGENRFPAGGSIPDGNNDLYSIHGDGTLYPNWVSPTYTVNFNRSASYGVSGSTSSATTNASAVSLPSATVTSGYGNYYGWTTDLAAARLGNATVYSGSIPFATIATLAGGGTTVDLYPVVGWKVDLKTGPECSSAANTLKKTYYKFKDVAITLPHPTGTMAGTEYSYTVSDRDIGTYSESQLTAIGIGPSTANNGSGRSFMEWNTSYSDDSHRGIGTSYWDSYTANETATLYAMYGYPFIFDAMAGGHFEMNGVILNGGSRYFETYIADYSGGSWAADSTYGSIIPDGTTDVYYNNLNLPIVPVNGTNSLNLKRIDSGHSYSGTYFLAYNGGQYTTENKDTWVTVYYPTEWNSYRVLTKRNSHGQNAGLFGAAWNVGVTFNANGGSGGNVTRYLDVAYSPYGNGEANFNKRNYQYFVASSLDATRGEAASLGTNLFTAASLGMSYTGKTFTGWNTAPDGSGQHYDAGYNFVANYHDIASVTLYAEWETSTYTVTYNANGGSGSIADATKTHGVALTLSNGSGFTGPQVTVTFNGNGAGSTVSTASASAYRTISRWDTAAAGNGTSYALSGSYTNNAALDLYAQWSAVTVDFSDTSTYTASRDGYTFDGWYTLAEGGSEVTSHEFAAANTGGSFEVFAHWTSTTVTVTFNMGGHGTAISPVTDNAGFSLSKPADPTADGYIFLGWYDSTLETQYTSFPLVINADTTLYAKWVKIERTLALTSAIDVYFMIPQSAFGAGKLDASTAKFTVNYVNRNGTGRSNATITAKSSATVDAVEYYVWVFSELNPAHLGENLVVTFYEGETEKATLNYSVIEYCYNQIDEYEKDKTAAKLKTAKICAGIVRYGVAAETYALAAHGIEVYETSASAGFAALNLNSVTEYNYNSTSYNPTSVDKSNVAKKIGSDASGFTGFEWVSGALDLGHNVRIKLNFTYTGADASSYSVKVKYKNGDSTVTEDLGNLEDLAGAVYYDNFNPSEFGRTLQFAVYNSSGTRVSKVLQYSVYSYLLTASGKTGNIKTLADTLINYGDAVYRFVNGEPA